MSEVFLVFNQLEIHIEWAHSTTCERQKQKHTSTHLN